MLTINTLKLPIPPPSWTPPQGPELRILNSLDPYIQYRKLFSTLKKGGHQCYEKGDDFSFGVIIVFLWPCTQYQNDFFPTNFCFTIYEFLTKLFFKKPQFFLPQFMYFQLQISWTSQYCHLYLRTVSDKMFVCFKSSWSE